LNTPKEITKEKRIPQVFLSTKTRDQNSTETGEKNVNVTVKLQGRIETSRKYFNKEEPYTFVGGKTTGRL